MIRLLALVAFLVCGGALSARAANAGDEVIIIYNTRVPESKGVADYYAERRHVPATRFTASPSPPMTACRASSFAMCCRSRWRKC